MYSLGNKDTFIHKRVHRFSYLFLRPPLFLSKCFMHNKTIESWIKKLFEHRSRLLFRAAFKNLNQIRMSRPIIVFQVLLFSNLSQDENYIWQLNFAGGCCNFLCVRHIYFSNVIHCATQDRRYMPKTFESSLFSIKSHSFP